MVATRERACSPNLFLLFVAAWSVTTRAWSPTPSSRRALFQQTAAVVVFAPAAAAWAAPDCYEDCLKNCQLIAPKDPAYCNQNCRDYCDQPDRTDGLSGSVSAASGEVGILGGTFGTGTVVKGEDKPPSINLPGLDFSSSSGRKLLGY